MVALRMRWLTSAVSPAVVPAALLALAFAAAAQTPPAATRKADRADPLDAGASVPAVAYESAFSRYRRAAEAGAIPWRESNDTAARIGGWRAYAREAQQPDPAASAPAPRPATPSASQPAARPAESDRKAMPMPMPMPHGHGGHKTP